MSKLLRVAVVGVALVCLVAVQSASAQGFSAGVRYWQADWQWSGEDGELDLGSGPFFIGYLGYHDASYSVIGQIGYGDGWDVEVSRTDLSLAVTQTKDLFTYGIGIRRMGYEVDDSSTDWVYYGPEILLALSVPLNESGLSLGVSGSLGVYIWDFSSDYDEGDGTTFGYTFDLGLAKLMETIFVKGGYRYQLVAEDASFEEDEFGGPYAELAFVF